LRRRASRGGARRRPFPRPGARRPPAPRRAAREVFGAGAVPRAPQGLRGAAARPGQAAQAAKAKTDALRRARGRLRSRAAGAPAARLADRRRGAPAPAAVGSALARRRTGGPITRLPASYSRGQPRGRRAAALSRLAAARVPARACMCLRVPPAAAMGGHRPLSAALASPAPLCRLGARPAAPRAAQGAGAAARRACCGGPAPARPRSQTGRAPVPGPRGGQGELPHLPAVRPIRGRRPIRGLGAPTALYAVADRASRRGHQAPRLLSTRSLFVSVPLRSFSFTIGFIFSSTSPRLPTSREGPPSSPVPGPVRARHDTPPAPKNTLAHS
jgi:hypothetical protein